MAVTYLPSGLEGLGEIFANLGASLGEAKWGERNFQRGLDRKLQENLRNPEELAKLAVQLGMAPPEEAAKVLTDLGIPVEFQAAVQNLGRPTSADVVDRARVTDPNFVPDVRKAETAETKARVPIAEATVAEAGAVTEEQELRKETFQHLRAGDAARITSQLQLTESKLGTEAAEVQREALARYTEMLPTMPKHFRDAASAAIANPDFLAHVELHEKMTLEEDLARIRASATSRGGAIDPMDLLGFQLKLNEAQRGATDRIIAANQLGGKEGESARAAAIAEVNGLARMYSAAFPGTPYVTARERRTGWLSGLTGGRLGRREAFLQIADAGTAPDRVVAGLMRGDITEAQVRSSPALRLEFGLTDPMINDVITIFHELQSELGDEEAPSQSGRRDPEVVARQTRAREIDRELRQIRASGGDRSRIPELERERAELRALTPPTPSPNRPSIELRGR